jgi:hypothetical protein
VISGNLRKTDADTEKVTIVIFWMYGSFFFRILDFIGYSLYIMSDIKP